MEKEDKRIKLYEMAFLLRVEEAKSAVINHLKRFGASILKEEEVRKIKLAYPIKHLSLAYFGYIHFEMDTESAGDLRNTLRLDDQVVRFLIVSPPFIKDESQRLSSPSRRREPRAAKPSLGFSQKSEISVSNDLLEEKLEEILNPSPFKD